MAANFFLTTGVVYVRGWSGTVTGGTQQNADGTAAAPSYSFAADTDTGFYRSASDEMSYSSGTVQSYRFSSGSATGLVLHVGIPLSWGSTGVATPDLFLYHDAANTLAQRNGTNAQTFRLYNTFTDASNYERLNLRWTANEAFVETGSAGTGSARSLIVGPLGAAHLHLQTQAVSRWRVTSNGHFVADVDNTYDIGASGATRPRTGYFGTSVEIGTNPAASGAVRLANATAILSRNATNNADINLLAADASNNVALGGSATFNILLGNGDFRAMFGGTTNSFPALKRSSAALAVRLADDSGDANFSAATITAGNYQVNAGGYYAMAALVMQRTAPTISSGFGTSPSIAANNGTAAFTVNVGTGGTASSGVIAMPAATTGWVCQVENRTGAAANRANQRTLQTATTTTSVTVQNQTISTGAALAWTASDIVTLMCLAY